MAFHTENNRVRFVLMVTAFIAAMIFVTPSSQAAQADLVPENFVGLGNGPFYSPNIFLVDKSKRTLTIWEQDGSGYKVTKEFKADFGKMSGDKVAVNDSKTPEGIYFFEKYIKSITLDFQEYGQHPVQAFPMNYPNLFDKRDGKTGYGIWLHTMPDSAPLDRGSKGCVVIRNNDFLEASQYIKIQNTPIIVSNEVRYIPTKEVDVQKKEVTLWLKKWLKSWQEKDISAYMAFYDKNFKSKGMNYQNWQAYKKGLAENYNQINIEISEPRIMHFRDEWVIEFIQKYSSDQYQDLGNKVLYVKGNLNNMKIIAEDFDPTNSDLALAQFDASHFSCCSVDLNNRGLSTARDSSN